MQTTVEVDFETRLQAFVAKVQEMVTAYYQKNFTRLTVPTFTIERGKRYMKIVRHESPGRSVYCFIDSTNGDVLKAASWKAPAKHARGNIYAEDNGMGGVTEYGGVYLRH